MDKERVDLFKINEKPQKIINKTEEWNKIDLIDFGLGFLVSQLSESNRNIDVGNIPNKNHPVILQKTTNKL